MPRRVRHTAASLPLMLTELTLASWETIARRTFMMATNACSPAEYRKMFEEKSTAAKLSGAMLARTGGTASVASLLAPWHSRATHNAKRLRNKA